MHLILEYALLAYLANGTRRQLRMQVSRCWRIDVAKLFFLIMLTENS